MKYVIICESVSGLIFTGSVSTGPKEAKPNAPYSVIMEVSDVMYRQISCYHYQSFLVINKCFLNLSTFM